VFWDDKVVAFVIKNEIDTDNVKAANIIIITRIACLFITIFILLQYLLQEQGSSCTSLPVNLFSVCDQSHLVGYSHIETIFL
jgi:hypothetical protein